MQQGDIVTFYSYKGGVGRTFALANIATLLCQWGYKVLCVDWDLEAPGLDIYFKDGLTKDTRFGLIELIQDRMKNKKSQLDKYLCSIHFKNSKSPLSLLKAGNRNKEYIGKLQNLNWGELYENNNLGNVLENLRNEWKEKFDFVLVDSRTGITDIGGICTVQIPDFLVVFLTANDQSIDGTNEIIERIKDARGKLSVDRGNLLIMPIISRFEFRTEYELSQKWLDKFAQKLNHIYLEWLHRDVSVKKLLNHLRIPYLSYWSFGERLPVVLRGTDDKEDIGYAFETVAAIISQRFGRSNILVRNRENYIDKAKKVNRKKVSIQKGDLQKTNKELVYWNNYLQSARPSDITIQEILELEGIINKHYKTSKMEKGITNYIEDALITISTLSAMVKSSSKNRYDEKFMKMLLRLRDLIKFIVS